MEQPFTTGGLRCSKCGNMTHTLIYLPNGDGSCCPDCLPPVEDKNFKYEYNPTLAELQQIKSLLKEILETLKE